jgi:sRNA-binding protein
VTTEIGDDDPIALRVGRKNAAPISTDSHPAVQEQKRLSFTPNVKMHFESIETNRGHKPSLSRRPASITTKDGPRVHTPSGGTAVDWSALKLGDSVHVQARQNGADVTALEIEVEHEDDGDHGGHGKDSGGEGKH